MMDFSYAWGMPNHLTFKIKPIKKWLEEHLPEGKILDPFANRRSIEGVITNDLNPEADVDYHMDAIDFLRLFPDDSVDCVLFDPPYSLRQLKECYDSIGNAMTLHESKHFFSDVRNEIARVLKPGGFVFSFGWSSVGIGKNRGFQKQHLLIVCHGGNHNDTLCLKEVLITGDAIGEPTEEER